MARWLAVLVDNKELVPFLRLEHGQSSVLDLTTMIPNQDRVFVEVYLVKGSRRALVHTFHADDVLRGRERPDIVVSGHVHDETRIALRIDGELIEDIAVDLPDDLPATNDGVRGFWIAALVIFLLAITAGGIWWWVDVRGSADPMAPAPGSTSLSGRGGTADPGTERESVVRAAAGDDATSADARPVPDEASSTAAAEPAGPSGEAASSDAAVEPARSATEAVSSSAAVESSASGSAAARASAQEATTPPEPPEPGVAYFLPESADLTAETTSLLRDLVAEMERAIGEEFAVSVRLRGHTALFGNESSRMELATARAEAVAQFVASAWSGSSSELTLTTESLGGTEPVTTDEDRQWQNRRVEVLATYSTHSTVSD